MILILKSLEVGVGLCIPNRFIFDKYNISTSQCFKNKKVSKKRQSFVF